MSTDSHFEPLIIRSPQLIRFSLLAFHLLLAAVALLLSARLIGAIGPTLLSPTPAIDYLVSFCIMACGIYALAHGIFGFVRGRQLTLSPEGLAYRVGDENGFVRWTDVERFRLEAPLLGSPQRLGWDYPPEKADKPHIWKRLYSEAETGTSLHGDLGHIWQGGAESVCAALERWRVRYGTSKTKDPHVAALDFPEIAVIRSTRRQYLLGLFLSVLLLVFFGGSYALIVTDTPRDPDALGFIDYVFLLILSGFSILLWACVRRIFAKPTLVLDTHGLSIRDRTRIRSIPWQDIAGFEVVKGYNAYIPPQVRWKSEPHLAAPRKSKSIGNGYAMNPYALRAMLEDWRIRFKPDA